MQIDKTARPFNELYRPFDPSTSWLDYAKSILKALEHDHIILNQPVQDPYSPKSDIPILFPNQAKVRAVTAAPFHYHIATLATSVLATIYAMRRNNPKALAELGNFRAPPGYSIFSSDRLNILSFDIANGTPEQQNTARQQLFGIVYPETDTLFTTLAFSNVAKHRAALHLDVGVRLDTCLFETESCKFPIIAAAAKLKFNLELTRRRGHKTAVPTSLLPSSHIRIVQFNKETLRDAAKTQMNCRFGNLRSDMPEGLYNLLQFAPVSAANTRWAVTKTGKNAPTRYQWPAGFPNKPTPRLTHIEIPEPCKEFPLSILYDATGVSELITPARMMQILSDYVTNIFAAATL